MDPATSCPSDEFLYYANFFCISDDASLITFSTGVGLGCLVLIVIVLYTFRKSFAKKQELLNPNPTCLYEETYCSLSLYILLAVQVLCIQVTFSLLFYAFQFMLYSKYQAVVESTAFTTCQTCNTFRKVGFQVLDSLIKIGQQISEQVIFLLQIYEWKSMLYIIKTQKYRSLGEIMFDHNHEIMSEPLTQFSSQ